MNSPSQPIRLFSTPCEAFFIERPNRFLVRCHYNGKVVSAHMPNPGRLQELLLPDARLLIVPAKGEKRKNPYTVVGVVHDDRVIMVHTHRTNAAVRALIERNAINGLKGATIIRSEVLHGNSRFDFLVKYRGKELYLEVKSCTLFGKEVAMFPDAVTARGARHLEELAELRKQGEQVAVIFAIQAPDLKYFMPDYHTDLNFAQTMLSVRRQVRFLPMAVTWNRELTLQPATTRLTIPWKHLEREVDDRGSYLLTVHLDKNQTITVGSLGTMLFPKGYYVYVGSAMKNLTKRIERHRRMRKTMHWHIDYLRAVGTVHSTLAIRASEKLECQLAESVARFAHRAVNGFGCSDCSCPSHLFGFADDPIKIPLFQEMLISYRMDRFKRNVSQR